MITITPQKLSEVTGLPIRTVYAWRSPSKKSLIPDDDGNFSLDVIKNRKFIELQLKKANKTINDLLGDELKGIIHIPESEMNSPTPTSKSKSDSKAKNKPVEKTKEEKENIAYINKIQQEKDELDLELKRAKLRESQLKIEQMEGDYIKVEDVIKLFTGFVHDRDKQLILEIEKKIRFICEMESVDNKKVVKYLSGIADMLNNVSNSTINQLLDKIEKI